MCAAIQRRISTVRARHRSGVARLLRHLLRRQAPPTPAVPLSPECFAVTP
jgi:hypothetical protein